MSLGSRTRKPHGIARAEFSPLTQNSNGGNGGAGMASSWVPSAEHVLRVATVAPFNQRKERPSVSK
jgi:hypothetical protein